MLNIKTLIAASLWSGMAVAAFAQAPATPAKAVPATTTATAPAPPTVAATDAGIQHDARLLTFIDDSFVPEPEMPVTDMVTRYQSLAPPIDV